MNARQLSRSLVIALLMGAFAAGCPIGAADAPTFGEPCTTTCAKGYFCSADNVCLPGDPPAAPVIDSFTADKTNVRDGGDDQVVLSWSTTGAKSCAIDGLTDLAIDVVGTTNVSFQSAGDITYTLNCTGDGGTASKDVSIHVRKVSRSSITLGSQDDVDAIADVEEIDGDLTSFDAAFTDLSGLQVRIVHGNLQLVSTAGLTRVGLDHLEQVDGQLIIALDDDLADVALPELLHVGGDFLDKHNAQQTSITLPKLIDIGGDVAWSTYEYGDPPDTSSPTPATLPSLTTVSAPNLETIGGWFDMEDADLLDNLTLPALKTIGGTFALYGNAGLTRLSLPSLTDVGSIVLDTNDVSQQNTPLAIEVTSLAHVHAVDDFQAQIYTSVYSPLGTGFFKKGDVRMVGNAFSADGSVTTDDNSSIEALDLSALQTVEGTLHLVGTRLATIDLPALVDVGGLEVTSNDSLTGASIPALAHVGAGGLVLPNDDNITGLAALTAVDGDLILFASAIGPFTSLTTVGGEFDVTALTVAQLAGFPVLADVNKLTFDTTTGSSAHGIHDLAIPSLTTVGTATVAGTEITSVNLCGLTSVTALRVANTHLPDLNGFAHMTSVTNLTINGNTLLAQCYADAFLTAMSPAPTSANVTTGNAGPVPTGACEIDPAPVCGG